MRLAARYAVAVLATVTGVVLSTAFAELVAPMRLFFLWVAVLFTAVVAGTGPALLAVGLSLVAVSYLVFGPVGSFRLASPLDVARVVMFGAFAASISVAVGLRRRAERRAAALAAKLRASELRYRTLVESTGASQAVWTADPDGNIDWSDAWLRITGQSQDQVDDGGGMSVVHPDDAARTWTRWETALRLQTPYEDELRVQTADGRLRWFAIRATPVVADEGTLLEWVGIIEDIDDRKRHEENVAFINRASELLASSLDYRQTMDNLARLCVPTLGDWCAVHIGTDENYERLVVQHSDPEQLQFLEQLGRVQRPAPAHDAIYQVLTTRKTQLVEELTPEVLASIARSPEQHELLRRLGFRSWIIAPMIARGRTLGTLTVVCGDSRRNYSTEDVPLIEDLARRAAIAIDNARLYEEAEAANRAKDEFLATLSHELRTPLTAISGWAHMLELGVTDEATTELAVKTILRSAKAQAELIDDLLDLSRVVAGTLQLHVAAVDLGPLAGELVLAAKPAADAKSISLELTAPSQPAIVRGDERRLRQIIWNLLTNAVKFTGTSGRVQVSLSCDAGTARIEVSDTGRGIEPEFLPHVWDRFRQADSSTSRQYGGLGLGLAVVRHLAEMHGGSVHATSAGVGHGSTFRVDLPLARSAEPADRVALNAKSGGSALGGRRVLVVDDDEDARLVMAAMLRQFGADVATAASVPEAMELVAARPFDAVVSDIAMPGEDGYALVRRVRAVSAAPVIAVSAIGTGPDDRRRALDAGFVEFVRKPVEPEELVATMVRVC